MDLRGARRTKLPFCLWHAWYFVLIDGSTECTYPPEEDLRPDPSGGAIRHPLLRTYFERFVGNRYLRNDVEWPGL